MALTQQGEKLFHGDTRVWGAPEGEDLPQQDPKRPPASRADGQPGRDSCVYMCHPTALQFLDSHITLVRVHPVKQGLRGHPLDRQPALGVREGGADAEALAPLPPDPHYAQPLTLLVFL